MIKHRLKWIIPVALLALSGCAVPFQSEVARFHQMPAPTQAATFTVQPADRSKTGSLEFEQYAGLVRQQLAAQGYQPAADASAAALVVEFDYGVNDGREKVATRPGFGSSWGGYHDPFWGWHGRYNWNRWGYYDPFWSPWGYGGYWSQPEVYSYTVYNSFMNMRIKRASTGEAVFEGRAEAQSRSDDLTTLVPNLVTAMFDRFPGRSGEKLVVKIKPDPKR